MTIIMWVMVLTACKPNVLASLPNYSDSETYIDNGFQDYTDFCKYYYDDENIIDKLEKNKLFIKVTDENINDIKPFVSNFKRWAKLEDWYSSYDFGVDVIKAGDYYYIDVADADYPLYDYEVYYFDTSDMILYYIHTNI